MKNSIAKEWLSKAQGDFLAAEILLGQKKKQTADSVCFHSQQAAEKYLKAFLTEHRIRFPKTHDLLELRTLAVKGDPKIAQLDPHLHLLNLYSVDVRYPGTVVTTKEAKDAFRAVLKVKTYLMG